ncbi:protocadherin-11 x-linked [Plakobranchus ocellatus]|uniref:Protocadherin-11 x-linked n=1 Tax=Plakobranchus ocellatus TaxID=259542 RepID=A0AAV3YJ48_9GAST|nr:protocadherin-11 x-linked [Plakobranchus ocellatus]
MARILQVIAVVLSISAIASARSIAYSVQEERIPPVLLGNIGVSANITSISGLSFSLLTRAGDSRDRFEDLFEVIPDTGDVRTRKVLDREQLCGSSSQCVLTASVAVSSPESNFIARYTLNIDVVDANDHRPMWSMPRYSTTISERAALNTTLPLPVAFDGDYEPMFKVRGYALEDRDPSPFDLVVQQTNKPDGNIQFELFLRLKKRIDREQQSVYNLALIAWDGNGPSNTARLRLVVNVADENDNTPRFDVPRYVRSVQDVTPPGTIILKVSAKDMDEGENGRVSYELPNNVDQRVLELFRLDPDTGDLKLNQSLGKETRLAFTVRAFDHGNAPLSSDVGVVINVEDTLNDPPRMVLSHVDFNGTYNFVKEDAEINKVVVFIDVIDNDGGDNGKVNCSARHEFFTLKLFSAPNNYILVVGKGLDRETSDRHTVIVNCIDHGEPALTSSEEINILVTDVNDFAPKFTETVYRMSVRENQPKDILVGSVFASDKDEGDNGEVRYSLPAGTVEFSINSKGFIYTAVRNLDRETKDAYEFKVYAYDLAMPPRTSTASVVIAIEDLNDEWPKFDSSSYHFHISEAAEIGTVVGKFHATDLDLGKGGRVEYILAHSRLHPNPPFSLSPVSGSMTLTQGLDFEDEAQYKFVVTASDLGEPRRSATVEVVIDLLDENDNSPVITFPSADNLSITLNLNVIPGHEVIQVIAHDADSGDNGRLSYTMAAAPNTSSEEAVSRLFWMNEDTGLVTLVAPLTPADARNYNIVVSVQDHGSRPQRSSQVVLVVQVVTESPPGMGSHRESYTTIVIAMVCVTLLVAVVVLLILCYIKYSDRRRYHKNKSVNDHLHHHQHADLQLHQKAVVFESPSTKYDVFTLENGGSVDDHDGSGDRSVDPLDPTMSPSLQKQPLTGHQNHRRVGSSSRSGKKSVTFDSDVRSSDTSVSPGESTSDILQDSTLLGRDRGSSSSLAPFSYHPSAATSGKTFIPPSAANAAPNPKLAFNTKVISHPQSNNSPSFGSSQNGHHKPVGWTNSSVSSFRPGSASSPSPQTVTSAAALPPPYAALSSQQGLGEHTAPPNQGGDEVVGVALQKHNALVRSMRGNTRRPPYANSQARRTSGEADICSSSSVETNDSGHGGSELDVSVFKANV